ncbi:binding-protein-dependent transport systems inner membrane component [Dickeya parazeae Ech586]|uniref:Binding-protein-dependent transport systems inner membrane component n=1 Tax=Dickeya zeae (strain Ech586) TaxID=590409 RepID=D2BW58_DICZ5|nr:nickel/cobalt ABC transporter permease [Dickeya parazeae]ACZ76228.1 binding-protein-dependent transport systems inner membrane component [Dickeya parazeae Ech586]
MRRPGIAARIRQDKLALCCSLLLLMVCLAGVFAPIIAPHDPTLISIKDKYQGVSLLYPLGTDNLGRCVFSRLVFGVRTTVFYSVAAMVLTVLTGGIIGVIAGYFKGRIDGGLMRLCDAMLAFPSEVMIFAIVGILGPGMPNILLAVVLAKWAWYARMIRGMTLRHSSKNYINYVRVIAAPPTYIMRRHLLPAAAADSVILASADIGSVILMISALSFLGLGAQPPLPEWGNMLSEAKNVMLTHPTQMLPAGIAIAVVVAACHVVGDFLHDALEPAGYVNREMSPS